MATPSRQRIVNAITDRLKTITKANGYRTDIGLHVFRWKLNPWAEKDAQGRQFLDGCNIKDKSCTFVAAVSGSMNWELEIEIEIFGDGEGSDTFLRSAEADVITMIGTDTKFGVSDLNARTWTKNFRTEMSMKQDERIVAGMLISFQVEFITPYWNPYASVS